MGDIKIPVLFLINSSNILIYGVPFYVIRDARPINFYIIVRFGSLCISYRSNDSDSSVQSRNENIL